MTAAPPVIKTGPLFLAFRCLELQGALRVFRRELQIGELIGFHPCLNGITAHIAVIGINGCRALNRGDGDNPVELDLGLAGFGIAALPGLKSYRGSGTSPVGRTG